MTILRPYSEYAKQESLADIDDHYGIISKTEVYRSKKVEDLRREHTLIMRRIDRITQQKAAYLRITGITPSSEKLENFMPVIKNGWYDTGTSESSSDSEENKKILIRKPTDPALNFIRDKFRENIPEIDIKLRDYNYQILKLSWREKRITYLLNNILKKETTAQQVTA
jgi:hypothetical protein